MIVYVDRRMSTVDKRMPLSLSEPWRSTMLRAFSLFCSPHVNVDKGLQPAIDIS